jgi:uncharacterized FlgJ-related protein
MDIRYYHYNLFQICKVYALGKKMKRFSPIRYSNKLKRYWLTSIVIGIVLCNLSLVQQNFLITAYFTNNAKDYHWIFIHQQIDKANQHIAMQRKKILALYDRYQKHQTISSNDIIWLINLYDQYVVFNPYDQQDWKIVLQIWHPLSPAYILKQATIISHDGTTKIARKGNNLFNLLSYIPMRCINSVSINADIKKNYPLSTYICYKKFSSPNQAIDYYIAHVNSHKENNNTIYR